MCRSSSGFSAVEMVVTMAVLAILLAVAVPSFQDTLEKRRLIGAVEQLYSDMQFARMEAIRLGRNVSVVFKESTTPWCYGITDNNVPSNCDCNANAASCTVGGMQRVVSGVEFKNITLDDTYGANGAKFDFVRGTAENGHAEFATASSHQAQVRTTDRGRIKICTDVPADENYLGYGPCS